MLLWLHRRHDLRTAAVLHPMHETYVITIAQEVRQAVELGRELLDL